MRVFHFGSMIAAALAAGVTLGCGSDPTGPIVRPPAQLNILRIATAAPPLWNRDTVFTCVKGQGCDGRIFFLDTLVGGRGEEFARLTLDQASLLRRPDGTAINDGDAVAITMSVVGDSVMLEFAPAGLRFDPAHPAKLVIEYGEAGDSVPEDFNGDGFAGDAGDDTIEQMLSVWREELPGDPFVKIGTAKIESLNEVEADLMRFSRYALAY
jgi:hypothetical protein